MKVELEAPSLISQGNCHSFVKKKKKIFYRGQHNLTYYNIKTFDLFGMGGEIPCDDL